MNIHPAVAFGAVIVGGALGGAMGALIAIPIVASVQAIIETYGRRYELIPEMEHPDDHGTTTSSAQTSEPERVDADS
jgi:predicted PurR-regulated permease PerM